MGIQRTKVIYCSKQLIQVIFDYIKNDITIYVKVAMSNMVSNSNYIIPWYFGPFAQQL